jgi:nucleoid DNA-binding protein
MEVPINPRRVLVFRASHVLKDQINTALSKSGSGKGGTA